MCIFHYFIFGCVYFSLFYIWLCLDRLRWVLVNYLYLEYYHVRYIIKTLATFIKMARTKASVQSLNKKNKRSRLEETFSPIVVENPIETVSKLIEDLKIISRESKRNCLVLDDEYYIWLDVYLNAVNIQARHLHDRDLGDATIDEQTVWIQLKTYPDRRELVYYYEETATEKGIPFILAGNFEKIVKDVDEQARIKDEISNFYAKLFKIFFRGCSRRHTVTRFQHTIYNEHFEKMQHIAWMETTPDTIINSNRNIYYYFYIEPCVAGVDNIRHRLGFGVSSERQIETVMLDDRLISSPEEARALLFSPNSHWGPILKTIIVDNISINGIRMDHDTNELQVHPITLEMCPEIALEKYCSNNMPLICFLDDDMWAQNPGLDRRTRVHTRVFITQLVKNLLDGSESRSIGIDENRFPYIYQGSDAKEEDGRLAARNLGMLFSKVARSHTETRKFTTGRVLNDMFFAILMHILHLKRKCPDNKLIMLLSEIILDSTFSGFYSYLSYSRWSTEECISAFKIANFDLSDAERKGGIALERRVFLYLRETIDQYTAFASELISGLTQHTKDLIKNAGPISSIIQGHEEESDVGEVDEKREDAEESKESDESEEEEVRVHRVGAVAELDEEDDLANLDVESELNHGSELDEEGQEGQESEVSDESDESDDRPA